jgi:hypothetical protein
MGQRLDRVNSARMQNRCPAHHVSTLGHAQSGSGLIEPRARSTVLDVPKQKALLEEQGFLGCNSLTITYFHTGTRTIIGVESFHGPVRDGKGWYQLAMVIRHDLLPHRVEPCTANREEEFWVVLYRKRLDCYFIEAPTLRRDSCTRVRRTLRLGVRTNTRVIGSSLTGN